MNKQDCFTTTTLDIQDVCIGAGTLIIKVFNSDNGRNSHHQTRCSIMEDFFYIANPSVN